MGKRLGLWLALSLTLVVAVSFPAAAESVKSKVKEVDKGQQVIVWEGDRKIVITSESLGLGEPGHAGL